MLDYSFEFNDEFNLNYEPSCYYYYEANYDYEAKFG